MGAGTKPSVTTDGRSVLLDLQHRQRLFKRNSGEWLQVQRQIDVIVAKNYLQYHIGESHV
jgi:hypothetical protein